MSYSSDYGQSSSSAMYSSMETGGQGSGGSMVMGEYPVADVPFTNQMAFQSTFTPSGFSFDSPFINNATTSNYNQYPQHHTMPLPHSNYQQQRSQPVPIPQQRLTPQLSSTQTPFSYSSTPSLVSDSSPHSRQTSLNSGHGGSDMMPTMPAMQSGSFNGNYQQQDLPWNTQPPPVEDDAKKKP